MADLKLKNKSHEVREKKYQSLCIGVAQGNATLGPEKCRQKLDRA